MASVGSSWLLDLEGVRDQSYHNQEKLHDILEQAAKLGNLEVLKSGMHQFTQQQQNPTTKGGCTLFLLLAESHLSAHTWPEYDKVIIDLFSCGSTEDAERVLTFLVESIPHQKYTKRSIQRGNDA